RDVIEVHLDLGGYPVTLLNTAGMRDSDDPVEREGVRRARDRAAAADLVLWVVDAAEAPPPVIPARPGGPDPESRATTAGQPLGPPPTWLIRNKIDLFGVSTRNESDNGSIAKSELPLQS